LLASSRRPRATAQPAPQRAPVTRDEIAAALASSPVHVPSDDQLAELRGRIAEALDTGQSPERKALLPHLVHGIRITGRGHTERFFRVPEPFGVAPVRGFGSSVEAMGLEPTNLLTASQALYQLSYAPGVSTTIPVQRRRPA
jgi:hypothetical protein